MREFDKYRKKPVVIEAVQFNGLDKNKFEICEFMRETAREILFNDDDTLSIRTLEGDMLASAGDFIIRGVSDEFYPCKPDIFEMTYEKV